MNQNDALRKTIKVDGVSLTPSMAVLLIAHAAGPRAIRATVKEMQILRGLRARRLVYFNRTTRPTASTATTRGREIIVALLATQADALMDRDVDTERGSAPGLARSTGLLLES